MRSLCVLSRLRSKENEVTSLKRDVRNWKWNNPESNEIHCIFRAGDDPRGNMMCAVTWLLTRGLIHDTDVTKSKEQVAKWIHVFADKIPRNRWSRQEMMFIGWVNSRREIIKLWLVTCNPRCEGACASTCGMLKNMQWCEIDANEMFNPAHSAT